MPQLVPFMGELRADFEARVAAAGGDIQYGGFIEPGETALMSVPGMITAAIGGPLGAVAGVAAGAALGMLAGGGGNGSQVYSGGGGNGHNMVVGGVYVNGSPLGIGVPEPPAAMVARQWKTKAFSHTAGEYWVYFFKLIDGRIMCWNEARKEWKIWRPKKPIVLYRGKITLSQAVKTQKMLDKLWRNVAKKTKALKLA